MYKLYGFTLYELAITIVILAILVNLAFPYFHDLRASYEVQQLKRTLTIHIQKAKTDAQLHHKNVTLCPSSNQSTCGRDWSNGFIGFIDQNKNRRREANESLIFITTFNHQYGQLTWNGAGHTNHITFQGDTGLPRGSNGTFVYCADNPKYHIQSVLSGMGHFRHEATTRC